MDGQLSFATTRRSARSGTCLLVAPTDLDLHLYDLPSFILLRSCEICIRFILHLAATLSTGCLRTPYLDRMSGQREIDVLVVGSGAAGMLAAVTAAEAGQRTVLLTKGQAARSGATATIIGGCSVDGRTCVDCLG
jgi:hypothetical protein